jgi:FdhD protein
MAVAHSSSPASRTVELTRVTPAGRAVRTDATAVEEPLEIRLQGTSFVVTMRTPGADEALAAGFLLAERVIERAADIRSMRYCTDTPDHGNVLDVTLTGAAADRAAAAMAHRRLVAVTSACGVCGRRSIEEVMGPVARVDSGFRISANLIVSLPERLRAAQAVFDDTGGLHAAAIFDRGGAIVVSAEDVGRHNAVDKAIGAQLLAGALPLAQHVLFVSGRTSFEIVQKAVIAGITLVAAVSAPSSLAVDLAGEAGMTLIGFVRGGSFNIYTAPERVET